MLESRIENGERTFLNGLSMGIYGDGSTANSIGGLQLLVSASPATGTVGGIDRSQWPFFRNIAFSALTNGGAAASAANILSYMDSLWVQLIRGRESPDLIVADNNMYKYYLQALQSIQRITSEGAAPELASAGYNTLKYMSSDVVLDGGYQGQATDPLPYKVATDTSAVGGAPTSTMYFLNTNYLHYRPSAQRNMIPLDPDRFSVNQDACVKLIGWAGNMTLSNAFLQGLITT